MTGAPKGKQDKAAVRAAGAKFAEKEIEKVFATSDITDNSGSFPKFSKDELTLGRLLGSGGFGSVYEVKAFDASEKSPAKRHSGSGANALSKYTSVRKLTVVDDDEVEEGEKESRKFISDHCLRNNSDCRYAVKVLKKEVIDDPPTYIQAIMDVAIETRVLSDTMHPNIIKLRAIGNTTPFDETYFIVMDRLYDTMEKRIEKWAKQSKRFTGLGGKLLDRKGNKAKAIMEEKLVAAFDLASAIMYLHQRKIVYRDLKPENVGFDIRDDVKLFDFGLAKELTGLEKNKDGYYKLTGQTGSPRYMAPEVGREEPYNESCDAYSFAIMFWQMYGTKTPFEVYTMKKLKATVWNEPHKRPFVPEDWPVPIKNLLKRAWSPNPHERPRFQQISKILRSECVRTRGGDDSGLEHSRRRSTFVFRGARAQLEDAKTPSPQQPVKEKIQAMNGGKRAPLIAIDDLSDAGSLGDSMKQSEQ